MQLPPTPRPFNTVPLASEGISDTVLVVTSVASDIRSESILRQARGTSISTAISTAPSRGRSRGGLDAEIARARERVEELKKLKELKRLRREAEMLEMELN
jgi:hypothetical protein